MNILRLAHVYAIWEDEENLYNLSGQTKRIIIDNRPCGPDMNDFGQRFAEPLVTSPRTYSLTFEEVDGKAFTLTKTPKNKTFEQGYKEGYEAAREELKGFLTSE